MVFLKSLFYGSHILINEFNPVSWHDHPQSGNHGDGARKAETQVYLQENILPPIVKAALEKQLKKN